MRVLLLFAALAVPAMPVAAHRLLAQIAERPARQGQTMLRRQFTGERLDLDDDAGGESGLGARCVASPPIRVVVGCRTAYATCSRSGAAYRGARR